jgi:hypothetical protein
MREVLRRGVAEGYARRPRYRGAAALLNAPMMVQNMLNWNPAIDTTKLPEQILDALKLPKLSRLACQAPG